MNYEYRFYKSVGDWKTAKEWWIKSWTMFYRQNDKSPNLGFPRNAEMGITEINENLAECAMKNQVTPSFLAGLANYRKT